MTAFQGLTAIVTGASRGFGLRTALRLYEAGANLVLSDLMDDPGNIFSEFRQDRWTYLPGDISDEDTSQDLVALALETFGRLDIAVNNAGIAQSNVALPFVSSEEARRIIDVDLMGVFFALKHQIPAMVKRHKKDGSTGCIVNIASVAGVSGAPTLSVYAAAKHGVVGLTRSAAAECARLGVRVNAVCPSFAKTDMVLGAIDAAPSGREAAVAELVRGVPMRRLAEIDEVVEAVIFAANPANSFMTGQAIAIDGGITAL
ncbi:SDR family NAD(P)-dependent oxidoreductase [Oricola cellulosilytica]|uniref:SDR family oxidoreductase n=1 Tax=Oricola cellulosilytica TaxID=1429082 RepID=A0A4R0PN66_9HYPH|nr:SDR family oxidoreductase [Oricola cellulosilytica]TCD16679.1 SDR family oxidoreductase [Oricola cellulosilytica]